MDKKITENIEESKLYMMLIFMLFMKDLKEKNAQWESFADELRYKNRFSVKHAIIDEIHECQNKAVTTYRKSTVLYRARVFDKINFDRFTKYYLQECGYSQADITKILKEGIPEQKIIPLMSDMLSDSDDGATSRLAKAQDKWRRKIKFKGGTRKNPVRLRLTVLAMAELILTIFGICICRKISLLPCMKSDRLSEML